MNHAIVLIHGYLETPHMWEFLPLADSVCTLRLTQPGHGPDSLPSVETMTDLAEAAISRINAAGFDDFILIGHSMGGYLSLEIAARLPERIRGLCLFHSTAREDSEEKKENRTKAIELIGRSPEVYLRAMVRGLYADENASQNARDEQLNKTLGIDPSQLQRCLRIMRGRRDLVATAIRLADRLCYVSGEFDQLIPQEKVKEELAAVKPSSFFQIAKAGHMSHRERPIEASDALLRWLESLI
jgi:pimeloyl-ACP methyl ester carboxylesterase